MLVIIVHFAGSDIIAHLALRTSILSVVPGTRPPKACWFLYTAKFRVIFSRLCGKPAFVVELSLVLRMKINSLYNKTRYPYLILGVKYIYRSSQCRTHASAVNCERAPFVHQFIFLKKISWEGVLAKLRNVTPCLDRDDRQSLVGCGTFLWTWLPASGLLTALLLQWNLVFVRLITYAISTRITNTNMSKT